MLGKKGGAVFLERLADVQICKAGIEYQTAPLGDQPPSSAAW